MNPKYLIGAALLVVLGLGVLNQTDLLKTRFGIDFPGQSVPEDNQAESLKDLSSAEQGPRGTSEDGDPEELPNALADTLSSPSSATAELATTEPETLAPQMDMLRVEPSGDTLVSGRSAPNSIVALLNNGEVVGTTVANEVGDWVLMLEDPLSPGDHDLNVSAKETEEAEAVVSEQSATVVINDDLETEPLVIVSDTSGASDVISLPDAAAVTVTESGAGTDAASESSQMGEETNVAVATRPLSELVADPVKQESPASSAPGEEATAAALGATSDPDITADVPADPSMAASPATEPSQTMETNDKSLAAITSPAPTSSSDPAEVTAASDPQTPSTLAADSTSQAVKAAAEEANEPFVTIRSLAIRGGKLIAEGDAIAGSEVKISIDGVEAANLSITDDESWRFESADEIALGPHSVEAALVQNGLALITLRENISREPATSVTVEAVEVEGDKLFVAGASLPNALIRVYVDDDLVGQTEAGGTGRWVVEARRALEAGQYRVRADQVAADSGLVLARAAVPFERMADDPVLLPVVTTGTASGVGVAQGTATATGAVRAKRVIIRKGDNLWQISRRLYGRGVRFSTIYQANAQEIENPNLIFPGQVFILPESDERWDDDPVVEWENIRG